jgi:hypothetical protein
MTTPLHDLAHRCGWPSILPPHNRRFTVLDDGDPHGLFYLIDPEGTMTGFGSCEGDMDEQRARFIMEQCNRRLDIMAKAGTIELKDRVVIRSLPKTHEHMEYLIGQTGVVIELHGQPSWAEEPWYRLQCGPSCGSLPQHCLEKVT